MKRFCKDNKTAQKNVQLRVKSAQKNVQYINRYSTKKLKPFPPYFVISVKFWDTGRLTNNLNIEFL